MVDTHVHMFNLSFCYLYIVNSELSYPCRGIHIIFVHLLLDIRYYKHACLIIHHILVHIILTWKYYLTHMNISCNFCTASLTLVLASVDVCVVSFHLAYILICLTIYFIISTYYSSLKMISYVCEHAL